MRIADNPSERTAANVNDEARQTALNPYDIVADVYKALQGFETDEFYALSRTRQYKENRSDGLFVYRIDFKTEFYDETAVE
jgi:hypothetical protein